MASLRTNPRSPFWIACFTLPDGRRTNRATKFEATPKNRKAAQDFADQLEKAARRKLTEEQARRIISDIYEIVNGDALPTSTAKTFFDDWGKGLEAGGVADATARAYRQAARDFLLSLGERQNADLAQIGRRDFANFRDQVAKRTTASTANKLLKYLRVAMHKAKQDGLVLTNPAADVATIKGQSAGRTERRPFTLPELVKVLDLCSPEWRGIVLFGFYTGQRLGDIVRLTWDNVDLAAGEFRFVTRKTKRRMSLPIAKPLAAYLAELPSSDTPDAPLFANGYKVATEHKGLSTLSQQFYGILKQAGLVTAERSKAPKDGMGSGRRRARLVNELSFHSLRHTATSLLKNAGVSEAVARDIIGHESEAISREYTHIEADVKRAALDKLPALGVMS